MAQALPPPAEPRALRDQSAQAARLARIDEPHVHALNDLVREIKKARSGDASVPWFDPDGGGIDARVLFLAQDPGPKATADRGGSGFISPDNDDTSAENTFRLREEASLDRRLLAHWNVVPWFLGHTPSRPELSEAAPWLERLLALLEGPVVMLVGKPAQRGWRALPSPVTTGCLTVNCPHPSPLNVNSRPAARGQIVEAYRQAAAIAQRE